MTTTALLLALAAALVHAGWNQLLAGSRDPAARSAAGILVATVLFAPLALIGWRWEPAVWPYLIASIACELAYFLALAAAYRRAPMGVIYPVARGTAPILVLAVGSLALGHHVSGYAVAGVGLVVAGILLVRGLGAGVHPRHLLLALGVGACIAAYTLLDSLALAHASPLALLVAALGATAVLQAALIAHRPVGRRRLRAALSGTDAWRTVAAGVGIYAAYGLVLLALTSAPAGPVAAVRETSVVMAMLLLAATGQERVTRARLAGAMLVAAGVVLVLR